MTQNIGAKVGAAGDQAVSITNPNSALAGMYATLNPYGALNVSVDANSLFSDSFEGASIDTSIKWSSTGSVAPANSTGSMTVNPSTTASATVAVASQPSFSATSPLTAGWIATIEATTIATGNHRFMGFGAPASAPGTSAAPLFNAIGFEIDTAGQLRASVYTQGTRTFTQTLTTPVDGGAHRYVVAWRGDIAIWYLDTFDIPAAYTQVSPATQLLPLRFASLNSASVTGTPTLSVVGAGVMDQARTGIILTDGTYPWRKNKIGAYGDQNVSIVNPLGAAAGTAVGVSTYGYLRATIEPHYLFNEPFDSGADTTNRWTLGGTVVPSAATGRLTVAQGASLSATSIAATQPSFTFLGLNFLGVGWIAKFEAASASNGGLFYLNSHRFMGLGVPPTTLSAAYTGSATTGPMLNAIGYEIDTDGLMYPVVYSNGVRIRPSLTFGGTTFNVGNGVANSSTNPGGSRALADGNFHTLGMVVRGDYIFWYVDGNDYPAASFTYRAANYTVPDLQTLPLRFHAVNGAASAPSGTMTMQIGSLGVVDTGSNHVQVADGTYPWRKATIHKSGAQYTNPGPSLLPSYTVTNEVAVALTANNRLNTFSIEHSAASTKTVKIRRITVAVSNTTAVAGFIQCRVYYGTSASTAGTAAAVQRTNEASAAAEATCKTTPTITAATLKVSASLGQMPATAGAGLGPVTIYDATSGSDMDPLTLRAGFLESLVVAFQSTGANGLTPYMTVYFTEE